MREQTFNATPLPLYPFKFMIPMAGAIVMLQASRRSFAASSACAPGSGPRA
jgi:hypothetical protein